MMAHKQMHNLLDWTIKLLVFAAVAFYIEHGLTHHSPIIATGVAVAFAISVYIVVVMQKNWTKYALMVGMDALVAFSLILDGLTIRGWVLLGTAAVIRKLVLWRGIVAEQISAQLAEEKDELVDALHYQATHDPLTECGNRALMEELNQKYQDECDKMGIIALDLDDFKAINEAYGHDGGDQVLKETTTRIQSSVRPNDRVIRLGGDEFAVLLPDTSRVLTERVAERVRAALVAEPMIIIDDDYPYPVRVTASIGVSQGNCENIGLLLREADKHSFDSKDNGKNQVGM